MKRTLTLLLSMCLLCTSAIYAQIDFTILNKPISYATNLDSLSRTGVSSAMPTGWSFYQSNGRQTYRANNGDTATANVYSYGALTGGAASRIRALGSISSKADTCYFGAEFVNNTGYAINSMTIAYTVEQWRLGATGRGPDTTEFDFSSNAASLVGGSAKWNHISYLDMISPVTKGTVGALVGTAVANQSKVSFKLTGLNIANGAHFWVRWYDHVIKGANDGLGLQAITFTAYSIAAGPTVVTKINAGKFPQTAGIPDTTVYGKFHGIVLSPNFVSNGGLQFSIRDSMLTTGPQAGIGAITCISATDLNGYKVNIGDSVYVTGKIRSYRYLTYIQLDTLKLIKANEHPNPASITANTINDNNESNLITLNNLSLTPTATWDTAGSSVLGGFTTTARGAIGNITIFINKNSNIFLKSRPNFPFNLTGIALQSSTTATNGYFIWPRFTGDFDTLAQAKVPLRSIGQINAYYTGAIAQLYGRADSINKKYFVKGVVHSPNLYYGGIYFNLIDNTGAITVYNVASVDGYAPKIGDSVLVRGTVLQLNGLIVLAPDSIKVLPKGTTLTPPLTTTTPIVKSMESYLLTIKGVKIADPINWDSTKAANLNMFEVKIAAGKDTFFMDIAKTTDLFRQSVINGIFTVTGVVGEYSTNVRLPDNDHYTIIPRGSFDISQGKIPSYAIGQIKPYNPTTGVADSLGVTCFTKGVVQSGNINDTGAVAFGIADNTGAIIVANINNASAYTPVIGDSITLLGTVSQVNGLTIFIPDSIYKRNSMNNILSPVVISPFAETYESALITIQGYTMLDPNQWDNLLPANKYGFNVQFTRGTDTVYVHISDNVTDLFNLPYAQKPIGKVDITGLELQKTNLAKAPFSNYYIVPRMISDFNENSGIEEVAGISGAVKVYPNPATDHLQISSTDIIEYLSLTDMAGHQILNQLHTGLTNLSINISDLKPGIYLLLVNTGAGTTIQKIIRE